MQNKAIYQSYYTRSNALVSYMVRMLDIKDNMRILEPCAGDGVFIDALLKGKHNLWIDAYEMNPEAFSLLEEKYVGKKDISLKKSDTLLDEQLTFFAKFGGVYDRIIANPPYGAWQDYSKRKDLKKLYPEMYVKETYTLFLYRCFHLLADHGKLVFITPDTYLNLHMHTALRNMLLKEAKISELALFPSSFFPNVNFGYANLSIITLEKTSNKSTVATNQLRILTGFKQLEDLEKEEIPAHIYTFSQREIYNHPQHAFFVADKQTNILLHNSIQRVGDVADCVTGIYSGNDKKYLRPISSDIRNSKNYSLIEKETVCHNYIERENLLDGIAARECFIPIVKGGAVKYIKPDNWYIDWSIDAVKCYKTDKKARFQNSSYYFKQGIGVPMVSSSQITGVLMEYRLFDQSIVGIFPKDEKWIYYLLALFNSPTYNRLIRTINSSANNSANYIKKIPFIIPGNDVLSIIDSKMIKILSDIRKSSRYYQEDEKFVNELIQDLYGL